MLGDTLFYHISFPLYFPLQYNAQLLRILHTVIASPY